MASSLDCIGLGIPSGGNLGDLIRLVDPHVREIGRAADTMLLRYDDPTGARLHLAADREHGLVGLLPSYAAPAGAELRAITPLADEVVAADVVEADQDDITTRLACDLAQWRTTPAGHAARASISAFGVDVTVHADVAAFDAARPDGGLAYAPESFISYGLFATGEDPPDSFAMLNGTVLTAVSHTVGLTGQSFHACRVRTVGFEAEVLLSAQEHPERPGVGSIIGGTVALVADLEEPRQRGRFRRR